jgi:hypothetical protein
VLTVSYDGWLLCQFVGLFVCRFVVQLVHQFVGLFFRLFIGWLVHSFVLIGLLRSWFISLLVRSDGFLAVSSV